MTNRATAAFGITAWEETAYHESAGGPKLSRVTVRKTFRGGVEAESTAELLTCRAADGAAGHVASERVVGRVGDRSGSFVVQHGGVHNGATPASQFGHVVPGSGTGELRGLTGDAALRHDEHGATFTLDYDVE